MYHKYIGDVSGLWNDVSHISKEYWHTDVHGGFLHFPRCWLATYIHSGERCHPSRSWLNGQPNARPTHVNRGKKGALQMLPSGNDSHSYRKTPFSMGKSTISMVIFQFAMLVITRGEKMGGICAESPVTKALRCFSPSSPRSKCSHPHLGVVTRCCEASLCRLSHKPSQHAEI